MIYIVGVGPGNSLEYLTLKAYQVIKSADVGIYIGEMIGSDIKDVFKDSKLYCGRHLSIDNVKNLIVNYYQQCKSIALMMPGDVSLYSGQFNEQLCVGEYVHWLNNKQMDFELIPGISSFSAANAKLKLDLTNFIQSQNVFISSFERLKDLKQFDDEKLQRILSTQPNLVLFQSFREWDDIKPIIKKHYSPKSRIIFVYKISWNDEVIIDSTLENVEQALHEKQISKHSLIIVTPTL